MQRIILTGAAGFISSGVASYLNERGIDSLVLVDDFSHPEKRRNYESKRFLELVDREELFDWLKSARDIGCVIHLGARTDTTERDERIFEHLNVEYSKKLWQWCAEHNVPFIYASSAATYGAGEHGYSDDDETTRVLKPLNPYGASKHVFDVWALDQSSKPPAWAGLKFFNVYGPNEYHKGRMASAVFHGFNQINKEGVVKLFNSYREGIADGEQRRDFIYVKDLAAVIHWLMHALMTGAWGTARNGIYNLGTGEARTFNDLARATFRALEREPKIHYVEMPADIRDAYQYLTVARMEKLREAGYRDPFSTLEEGVQDYVRTYLSQNKVY